jgi:aminoglycoside phosphotransferase family enzyme/predicted kinase
MAEALRARAKPDTASLVEALRNPAAYPHPVGTVKVLQTHISYVLLAGDYAYKIKKPVRLAFVDFSTAARRRFFCEQELRLNRRTAPSLYVDVVAIGGDPPRFGPCDEALEYAVRMRRFPQDALGSVMAREGRLQDRHVDALARHVAAFHASLEPIVGVDPEGARARVLDPALDNLRDIAALDPDTGPDMLALREWTLAEAARLAPHFAERSRRGFVRDGHGDLHLGNVAFIGEEAFAFDCLEFEPALRHADVMSDVAFTVMDLACHGLPALAARYLDTYLQETGDYAGLAVLRFLVVYRALVRAKVACIQEDDAKARKYIAMARRLARPGVPALFLMHGLPASGKTQASQRLLEALGAVRVRSDVERKRAHGLTPLARSGSPPDGRLYSPGASDATYERLAELAAGVLDAGYPVVVDCAALERRQRDPFREVARSRRAGFAIVRCHASDAELRRRLRARRGDASEADEAVLDLLRARAEPIEPDELPNCLSLETG